MSLPPGPTPWDADPLRGDLGAETMLSHSEVNYLHWLGKSVYSGAGRVVELGSFLGGSTLALCKGLAQNPAWTAPLLAYDRFIMFNDQENRYAHIAAPGESFLPVFQNNLRAYAGRVTARPMSLPNPAPGIDHTEAVYPEREPVEILFIDAAKSWPVHLTILQVFGPHLIPGKSIVVQQDFKWATVFYLPLHMHELRDCFEPVHDVAGAGTTGFLYTGGIEDRLADLSTPDRFDPRSANLVWDEIDSYWLEHLRGDLTHMLLLLRAQHLASLGAVDEAAAVIESAIAPAIRDGCDLLLYGVVYASTPLLRRMDADSDAAARIRACRDLAEQARPALQQRLVRSNLDSAIDSMPASPTGVRPTAILFGAGQFTRRLLTRGTRELPFRPLAIVDDHTPLDTISGVPVVRPSDLAPHATADFILISSDAHADALEARARAVLGDDIPVVRVDRPTPAPQATP